MICLQQNISYLSEGSINFVIAQDPYMRGID